MAAMASQSIHSQFLSLSDFPFESVRRHPTSSNHGQGDLEERQVSFQDAQQLAHAEGIGACRVCRMPRAV